MFCKNAVLKNFTKFKLKHLQQRLFLGLKKRLQCNCFSLNFAKFFRVAFLLFWRIPVQSNNNRHQIKSIDITFFFIVNFEQVFAHRVFRGVFRTQQNTYVRAFSENSYGFQALTIFVKSSIVNVRLGSKYASGVLVDSCSFQTCISLLGHCPEEYLKPFQTFKMEHFAKIVNVFQLFTTLAKSSILDV